ncbi:MAG: YciI family protein [Sphingobacteriales bacterium]
MKEFLLLFRSAASDRPAPTPEELQNISKPWQDWMGSIAAQNKLANRGNRLDFGGATVMPGNVVTDGPYAEIKEILAGYIVVNTASMEEAVELAKGCPILAMGGNVEVRGIIEMNM